MKRLFIAVPIPDGIKRKVSKLYPLFKETGADLKFVSLANLHFTLKFLGDVEEEMIEKIEERLANICANSDVFEIFLDKVGVFPSFDRIKVLWVGAENNLFSSLVERMEKKLSYIRKDDFQGNSVLHLTFARVKSVLSAIQKKKILKVLVDVKKMDFGRMMVDKVVLYESKLTAKGPIYAVVKEFRLLLN